MSENERTSHPTKEAAVEEATSRLAEATLHRKWLAAVWTIDERVEDGKQVSVRRLSRTSWDYPRGTKWAGGFQEALEALAKDLHAEIEGSVPNDDPLPEADPPPNRSLEDRIEEAMRQEPPEEPGR